MSSRVDVDFVTTPFSEYVFQPFLNCWVFVAQERIVYEFAQFSTTTVRSVQPTKFVDRITALLVEVQCRTIADVFELVVVDELVEWYPRLWPAVEVAYRFIGCHVVERLFEVEGEPVDRRRT